MLLDDGRVISNFIKQGLIKKPITIYGDGYQTRSFCYIDDLINGLIDLMNSGYNKPLNIGNNYEISILELAKKICQRIKVKESFKFEKAIEGEPKRRCPDLKNTYKKLKWRPKIELNKGIDLTIKYFKESYFS